MKRKSNNLTQETFDFFPAVGEWPIGYYKDLNSLGSYWHKTVKGMDIETKGLNPYDAKVMILSVGVSPDHGVSLSSYCRNGWNEMDLERFKIELENPNNILCGQNIKYDVNWIAIKTGINVKAMLFDIQFAQYLLDENDRTNSLEGNIKRAYISNPEMFEDLKDYKSLVDRDNLDGQHRDDLLLYNNRDADASRRLYNYYVPKLIDGGYDKLMGTASLVLPVLSKIETRGVYLDKEWAYKTQTRLFDNLVKLRYSMCEIAQTSFKPESPQQLASVLFGKLRFTPTNYTDSGQASTTAEAMGYLVDQATTEDQNKFLDAILQYKKEMKLLTTYYQPIEKWTRYDGRVHANYSLGRYENEEGSGGTVTGRLSCREPNLQNIPRGKEHRGMFRATTGYTLLDGDFSQLELRVAAYLSQDPRMMEAFQNNLDIHTAVMSELTGIPYEEIEARRNTDEKIKMSRVAFKEVNFGIFYLMSAKRLQRSLRTKSNIYKTVEECQEYIKQWFAKFWKAKEWIDTIKVQAVAYKYVRMPLGQIRRLPEASFDRTREAAHAMSQACNFPVQSFASWICLIGLILLQGYIDTHTHLFEGYIIMQVHDSVTMEIKLISNLVTLENIKADVKKIMEVETLNYIRNVFGINFNVPLVFDIEIKDRWS